MKAKTLTTLWTLTSLFLLASWLPALAQRGAHSEEAMETLRFIRLAETKKRLNLDEAKLLELNEMLDDYELKRFELQKRQGQLHRQVVQGYEQNQAKQLLVALRQVRQELSDHETFLWDEAEKILEPHEALEFFQFYAKFQSEVRRRVRALQEGRNQKDRPNRRKNKRNRGY